MEDKAQWWWKDSKGLATSCRNQFPAQVTEILECAERTASNTFWFTEKWEMECTPEPVVFHGRVEWEQPPADDPEWVFALNRHTCFLSLGQAYLLTGEERWGDKFAELLRDWIARVPLTAESMQTSWRTLDTGLRSENWLKSWCCFKDCSAFTKELYEEFCTSLRKHAEYLYSVDDDFRVLSNWGVLQNHGLFLLGVFFQEQRYVDCALERLNRELVVQVLPDGVQWEQSPMYHCEVLRCYLDTIVIARRNAVALPQEFQETVHRMVLALAVWCKPDGCLPCQSDSDEIDARDLLAQGSLLFHDGELKHWAGPALFWENLWNLGDMSAEYNALTAKIPVKLSQAMPESGNYVLRSSAGPDSQYLRFHCGCMGSGHGHADQLHIDLYSYREDILIDPGRYTYVDSPIRRKLKQPAAHNTVRVDGWDFSQVKNSWDYACMAMPVKGEYLFGKTAEFVSGGHLGYMELPTGAVYVNRKVVWVKPGTVLICDEFYGNGTHMYEQYFHFGNEGKVSLCPGGAEYHGKKAQAKFFFLTPGVQTERMDSSFSKKYNQLEQGTCVRNTWKADGPTTLLTVICTAQARDVCSVFAQELPVFLTRDGRELRPEQAQAVRICRDSGEEAVVLLCHREIIAEVGLIKAGNYKGYGKTIVFTPEQPDGECLQW